MPYEDLIKAVEASAEERIREIGERTRIETEEILSEARLKEEDIKQKNLENTKKALELEKIRQISSLREEARMQLTKKKDEIFQRSFRAAQKKLETLRNDPEYPRIFRSLLKEALQEMEGVGRIIHVDPRDETLCRSILAELNMNSEVITDLQSSGGLTVTSTDGSITILNTLESRLEVVKEQMRAEVFSTLFGD